MQQQQQPRNNEITINLKELFFLLLHRWWMIALATILCAVGTFYYTYYLVEPLYQSDAMIYVNSSSMSLGDVSISAADLSTAKSLVDTYIVILDARITIDEINAYVGSDYSYDAMRGMIAAGSVNSTEIFQITVTNTDPVMAEAIADAVTKVLPQKIADIVEGSSVKIVDTAILPSVAVSPSYSQNTMKGAAVGMMLSGGIIVLLYLLDQTIGSVDYLAKNYKNIPVLAVVPEINSSSSKKNKYYKTKYESKPQSNAQT